MVDQGKLTDHLRPVTLAHDVVQGMIEGLMAKDGNYPREPQQQTEDTSTPKPTRSGVAAGGLSHSQHSPTAKRLLTVSDIKIA